jgi:hypothetical protein
MGEHEKGQQSRKLAFKGIQSVYRGMVPCQSFQQQQKRKKERDPAQGSPCADTTL